MIFWMRALLKFLLIVVLLAAVGLGGAWWWAGRQSGPSIELKQPGKFVGQSTSLDLTLQAPGGALLPRQRDAVAERREPRCVHARSEGGRQFGYQEGGGR